MKIDFGYVFVDLNGMSIKDEDKTDLTLQKIAMRSVAGYYKDEDISGDEKLRRWELALKIKNDAENDFKVEEIVEIKKLINKMYSTLIVGQAWKMIDG